LEQQNIDPQPNIQTEQTSQQQPPTNTDTDPQPNTQPEHTQPQPEQALPQPTPMDIDNHQVNLQTSTSTVHIASDQPSSSTQPLTIPTSEPVQDLSLSDSDLEILEQPPLDILESEYIDSELLKILSEMQDLVQNKRMIDLTSAYEE
jgi:hypothetical protein